MIDIAVSRLNTARRLYASMSARAGAAYNLIKALRACEVLIPSEILVNEVASTVYHSASYDAYERYSCLEEFEEALREDMDESLTRRDVEGTAHYVLHPYFNKRPDIDLPGARVSSLLNLFYARKEFETLHVDEYVAPVATPIEGVSEEELRVLAESYNGRSLAIVNALRMLKTALVSASTTFSRLNPAELGMTAEVEAMLLKLGALTELPMLPPTARWFGTEADRINPLPALPEEFVAAVA